ncbi:MAG: cell division protein FtsZ [Endomicrobia bacterium]|nr:cell division protein FtsZ [Endomicrobiia bacterium]MCL2507217.1 cell division protein FtsZ [Endomicrobiia bacterium]
MAMKIILPQDGGGQPAIIKVIGVGGGGTNAVNRIIAANVTGVEFIAVNTDIQALRGSAAPVRVQIGEKTARGRGGGGDPTVGQKAAEESVEILRETVRGADMVFVAAAMGGATGTGAAPVVAQIAKEEGILTIGIVTKPLDWEEKVKMDIADKGINNLRNHTDALIVIPNEKVFPVVDHTLPLNIMYEFIDGILRQAVQAITDVITQPGEINVDFNDVKNILANSGTALIGIGESLISGDVKEAVRKAVTSPLLGDIDISLAGKMLVHITATGNLSIGQFKEITDTIKRFGMQGHIKYGQRTDNRLDDKIKVTIIATGFENGDTDNKENKKIGQTTLSFDDVSNKEPLKPEEIDFSKPAYTYWKVKKLK